MQDRLVLTGVQMRPLPLWLMIVKPTPRPTFGTWPVHHLMVVQVDVHLALSQLQFHSFYEPRCFDSENLQVEFTILHPSELRTLVQVLCSRLTTNPEFLKSLTRVSSNSVAIRID
jgi:hypothetical protein